MHIQKKINQTDKHKYKNEKKRKNALTNKNIYKKYKQAQLQKKTDKHTEKIQSTNRLCHFLTLFLRVQ